MEALNKKIFEFDPITLGEMDSVKLLDRTDTKFIFHKDNLAGILDSMKDHYKVLDIKSVRNNEYETLYYDTTNFELYLRHHNERLNRYKIRFRKYVGSDLHFFEIKFKNNKGRTIKSRIQRPQIEQCLEGTSKQFLSDTTNLNPDKLHPVFWVNYSRVTFVSKNFEERLTLDTNLTFKNDQGQIVYDNLIIAELKQEKASLKSPFARTMLEARIKENSISKYCLGVTQLVPDIKKNNFKPKLLTLNKLIHATS